MHNPEIGFMQQSDSDAGTKPVKPPARHDILRVIEEMKQKKAHTPGGSLEKKDPDKVAEALHMITQGNSFKEINKKTKIDRNALVRIKRDYWTYICDWREAVIQTFEERFVGLEDSVILASEKLQERLISGDLEVDADAVMKLAKAQEITMRCIQVMKGEPTSITAEKPQTTAEDVARAREEALAQIREAEVVLDGKEAPAGSEAG